MPVCLIKSAAIMTFALLLFCTILPGQAVIPTTQHATFHVQGTISVLGKIGEANSPGIPGAEVQFRSEQMNKSVSADDKGFYQLDLPVGTYSMTAQFSGHPLLREYRRPPFRVTSPTTITLDGTLYLARTNCDMGPIYKPGESRNPPSPEQRTEAEKDLCGGEDVLPIPSENGVQLQLYVRYQRRSSTDRGRVYNSGTVAIGYEVPVVVEFNLFTLVAKEVIYDIQRGTLEANGNVVTVNESGARQRADSMTLKIENGQAIQLQ